MYDGMYFQIYKNIENEVLKLSESILFIDENLNVCSQIIADLIIRCSIEIESIIQDLYREGRKELHIEVKDSPKPGKCIQWLNKQYILEQKTIGVVSTSFYFCIDDVMHFRPFDYEDSSKEDYYKVYCALKHDRKKNIKKASLFVLIRVLGALFILNIIYKNKRIDLGQEDRYGKNLDKTGGSDIFSFIVAPCRDIVLLDSDKDIIDEQCLYRIVREKMEYCLQIKYINKVNDADMVTLLLTDKWFQDKVRNFTTKDIDEITFENEFLNCLGKNLKDFCDMQKIQRIDSIKAGRISSRYWAELNRV